MQNTAVQNSEGRNGEGKPIENNFGSGFLRLSSGHCGTLLRQGQENEGKMLGGFVRLREYNCYIDCSNGGLLNRSVHQSSAATQ